jgi:hypothetical protein
MALLPQLAIHQRAYRTICILIVGVTCLLAYEDCALCCDNELLMLMLLYPLACFAACSYDASRPGYILFCCVSFAD